MSEVPVPATRIVRWVENFASRHGAPRLSVTDGALCGVGADGSTFVARLPFEQGYAGPPDPAGLAEALELPDRWAVLLVRKGGFAVARMAGDRVEEHKIGQRHVQGRTKAGGQSQQRFARRRDNQARQAYEAAAEHAVRLLGDAPMLVVTGGDHSAVDEVLADPRLRALEVTGPWLAVADPRRSVLDAAIEDARALRVEVTNAD